MVGLRSPPPVETPQPWAPPPPKRRLSRWRITGWILSVLLLLFLATVTWLAIVAPPSRTLRPIAPPSVTLLASNGSPILWRGAVTDSPADVRRLPDHASEAFLAIEDRRFHHHIGVDPRGIGRGLAVVYLLPNRSRLCDRAGLASSRQGQAAPAQFDARGGAPRRAAGLGSAGLYDLPVRNLGQAL